MTVTLSEDELNLLLSSIGLALSIGWLKHNVMQDDESARQLLALQAKLMKVRGTG